TFAVPPELLLQVPADQEAEQVTVEDPAGDGSLSGLEVSVPVERGETWLAPMAVARDAAGGSPLVVSQLFRSDASEIVSLADNSGRLDVPLDRPTQDQPWILRYTAEDSAGNQATPKALVVNVQCTDVCPSRHQNHPYLSTVMSALKSTWGTCMLFAPQLALAKIPVTG
ncbi:hypothetical protein DUNSADRAFT_17745, partial [Dunaliella salina]